jgi:hypothetical protein
MDDAYNFILGDHLAFTMSAAIPRSRHDPKIGG